MGKKKPATSPTPQIFEATLGAAGAVTKGAEISQHDAEAKRQRGEDVVVCGSNTSANRSLAGIIERNANGGAKRCPPHTSAGPNALPHFQPDPRPPDGHTFYETDNRKAV